MLARWIGNLNDLRLRPPTSFFQTGGKFSALVIFLGIEIRREISSFSPNFNAQKEEMDKIVSGILIGILGYQEVGKIEEKGIEVKMSLDMSLAITNNW